MLHFMLKMINYTFYNDDEGSEDGEDVSEEKIPASEVSRFSAGAGILRCTWALEIVVPI